MMLENVVLIDASQSVVWSVTIDIARWPQWMPTVTTVKRLDAGHLDYGSAALIKQPGLPEAKWVVTAIIPGERFTWETQVLGIRMIATHELATKGTRTQSILRVEMSGIVAQLLWPHIYFAARRSLQRENASLKKRCEALCRQ